MPSFYQEQQSSFSQKAAYGYAYVCLLFDLCGFCSRFSCHEWRLHVLGRSHRFFFFVLCCFGLQRTASIQVCLWFKLMVALRPWFSRFFLGCSTPSSSHKIPRVGVIFGRVQFFRWVPRRTPNGDPPTFGGLRQPGSALRAVCSPQGQRGVLCPGSRLRRTKVERGGLKRTHKRAGRPMMGFLSSWTCVTFWVGLPLQLHDRHGGFRPPFWACIHLFGLGLPFFVAREK